MADTNALISIEEVTTRYLLKYKKTNDDYTIYLEHICNCVRDFQLHDSHSFRSEKVSVDSLGIIELPDDCVRVHDICVAYRGEWWSFTERPDMVNTTTTVGLVETQDSDFGEGVALLDNKTYTYGAKGAVNAYYYKLDWNERRIFCDGIKSDTVLLKYVSNGINADGDTYIPEMITPVLDAYLLWRETYWLPELIRERQAREKDYHNERLRLRNLLNGMTISRWKDVFWGSITLSPKR